MMEITLLGTSCMTPTKDRNVSGTYIEINGIGILFDCGEGSQRQMNIAGIARTKVRYIFISHWHADHIAGLLGLIQTIGHGKETPKIDVYGPKGTKEHFDHLMKASIFDNKMDISVHELTPKGVEKVIETKDFIVNTAPMEHFVPCIGYSIQEPNKRQILMDALEKKGIPQGPHIAELQAGKNITFKGKKITAKEYTKEILGKKFTYIPDTCFTDMAIKLAENSELLLSEATFTEEHKEKAIANSHMTAQESAQIASMSNSKRLIINHFSQRYKTLDVFLQEARAVFPESEVGFDLMTIKIKS